MKEKFALLKSRFAALQKANEKKDDSEAALDYSVEEERAKAKQYADKANDERKKAKEAGKQLSPERRASVIAAVKEHSKRMGQQSVNESTRPPSPIMDERSRNRTIRMNAPESDEPPAYNKPLGTNYNPWLQAAANYSAIQEKIGDTKDAVRVTKPSQEYSKVPTQDIKTLFDEEKALAPERAEAAERGTKPETQLRIGRGYAESSKELFSEGAPTKNREQIPREIQTARTNFTPEAEEKYQQKQQKQKEQAEAAEARYGQFADTAHQTSRRTAPTAVDDVARTLGNDIKRTTDPKFTADPVSYLLHQLGYAHNRISDAKPLGSLEQQRSDVAAHHLAARKRTERLRTEEQQNMVGGSVLFGDDTAVSGQAPAPYKEPTAGMTEEEIKATYPDYQKIAEMGQTEQYKRFQEQMPTGAYNLLSGSHINRMLPKGLRHPASWLNAQNTPRELANSHMLVNLRREDPAKLKGITPTTSKDAAKFIDFPSHGERLYFKESTPIPTTDHEAFMADAATHNPQEWQDKVNIANSEKDRIKSALGQIHQSLSDALIAHANGKTDEHTYHINQARQAAKTIQSAPHNSTHEAKAALSWLNDIPTMLDRAGQQPQTQEHKIKDKTHYTSPYKDALRAIRNETATHIHHVHGIGDAFDEKHVSRLEPEQVVSGKNIKALEQKNPEHQITMQEQDWLARHPIGVSQRSEETQPIVYSDPVFDPDVFYSNIDNHLSHGSERDNSLTKEMKEFVLSNSLRQFTHPHEFKEGTPHPTSEEFLGSVPITQMHNYFSHNDPMKLGGMPARKFVETMSQNIMNEGFRHLEPQEQKDFVRLNTSYDQGLPMSDEEAARHSELAKQINENGFSSLAAKGKISSRELHHWNAARFIAANRQHRDDYHGRGSTNELLHTAEDLARNYNGDDLKQKLTEIKQQLPLSERNQVTYANRQLGINPKPTAQSSRYRMMARKRVDELIKQAIGQHKAKQNPEMGKSMPTHTERLKKCRDSYSKVKDKLTKAVPQGKYVKAADGSLILVDYHSRPVQQQIKETQQAQQKTPEHLKQPQMPKPVEPPKPTTPPIRHPVNQPKAPTPPQQQKAEIPKPKPVTTTSQKKIENITDAVRKIKAEDALAAFGYKPRT